MSKFLTVLFILALVPGIGYEQEIVRTSRYEVALVPEKTSQKIDILRERYKIPLRFSIISPSLGDDIILTVYRTNLKEADVTLIQSESIPFLFNDDALAAYYMLFNKEPVIIGSHAYFFDEGGSKYKIYYLKDGSIKTAMMTPDQAFLTNDGYMLKVWRSKKHE
jgi:hypothetical protein